MTAAHELKSPLVLMRQLALRASDDTLPRDQQLRLLDQLVAVSDRGLRLTSDLTRTARLDASLFPLEPINAIVLCESLVRDFAPLYQMYQRHLSLDLRARQPLLVGHRDLLSRVLANFIDNALHYGDDTPVALSLRSRRGKLRIGVRDYGPALTPREWRRLKAGQAAGFAARPQGSGLGLVIAERFAETMGGTTGVVRHRDGATFYIELPQVEQLALL